MIKRFIDLKFKELFNSWIESSTVHGVPNIFRNKNWILKFFWTFCVLCSSGYCVFNLTKTLIDYFEFNVITEIRNERMASIQFPAVSFCNKNPFNLGKNGTIIDFLKKEILDLKNNISTLNEKNENTFLSLVDRDFHFSKLVNKYEHFLPNVSFGLNEMIVNCEFQINECNKQNFEYFWLPSYGNCFKFNSGKNSIGEKISIEDSKIPGKKYGLRLELFSGFLNKDLDLIRSSGINLFIHNHSTVIFSESDSISLSNGFEFDIVVSQEYSYKLSKPHSNCIKDPTSINSFQSDLYRKSIELYGRYQQKTCLIMCYHEFIKMKCDCYYPEALGATYNTSCNSNHQMKCSQNEYLNYLNSDHSLKCFDMCPKECETFYYKTMLSFADFPSPYYAQLMIDNPTYKDKWNFSSSKMIKKSVVAVNIYHDDISLTHVNETPAMNINQLISNIGGILGICVGMSILSVVELLDLLIKVLFHVFKKINSAQVQSRNES
ncbi:DEgenerin Like [Brachionus plicatilis]|uniref:DEgenerin Like n=1 Tax=Brachionus plicatilis TaxID=10195 RepID=A0A3M7PBM0_BRAPC|nr:DEgenerin Like [Brachionus plicatilis]